jgi:hypothetical protein
VTNTDADNTPAEVEQPQETPEVAPAETPEGEAPVSAPGAPTEEAEATAEGEEEAPEEPTPADKHKRAGGWQRKIQKLENEIARLSAGQQTQPAQPTQPAKELTPEEKFDQYVSKAVERRLAAAEQERAQQQAAAEFQRRTQEVRAAHPDFDEAVEALNVPVDSPVGQALLTSEHGPAIMYQLATNPDVLARISALPPLAAVREIGRLEAQASATAAPKKTAPTPVPRKPAPVPITPVTARGQSAVKSPDKMTFEEYNAWRDSQAKR